MLALYHYYINYMITRQNLALEMISNFKITIICGILPAEVNQTAASRPWRHAATAAMMNYSEQSEGRKSAPPRTCSQHGVV